MNTKTKLYIVFLIGFFAIRWWLLNRNYLLDIGSKDIAILNDIASSYSGYNDIYVHGSAYTLFYLLLVNMFLPNMNNQVLLRMNRISYIRWLYWKMVYAAAMFTVVFVSVAVLFMTGTIGPQMLFKWGYYYSVLLTLVLTFLYYVLMRTVFLFMYIVAGTKTKALFAVYFISVFLVGLPYFTRIYWTPVISLVVMDDMLESNIHIGKIMLNIVKLSGLSLFFYLFTAFIFNGKDLLRKNG